MFTFTGAQIRDRKTWLALYAPPKKWGGGRGNCVVFPYANRYIRSGDLVCLKHNGVRRPVAGPILFLVERHCRDSGAGLW